MDEIDFTPNPCLRYSNVSLGRGFVNISAICSFVAMYSILAFFSTTYSLRKRYFIRICFVFEFITGFFEIFMASLLSRNTKIGSLYSTLISCNVCFIQKSCVQQATIAMYYASTIYREIEDYFLLNHDTRQFPKKNSPPLVLYMSSTLPSQVALV